MAHINWYVIVLCNIRRGYTCVWDTRHEEKRNQFFWLSALASINESAILHNGLFTWQTVVQIADNRLHRI